MVLPASLPDSWSSTSFHHRVGAARNHRVAVHHNRLVHRGAIALPPLSHARNPRRQSAAPRSWCRRESPCRPWLLPAPAPVRHCGASVVDHRLAEGVAGSGDDDVGAGVLTAGPNSTRRIEPMSNVCTRSPTAIRTSRESPPRYVPSTVRPFAQRQRIGAQQQRGCHHYDCSSNQHNSPLFFDGSRARIVAALEPLHHGAGHALAPIIGFGINHFPLIACVAITHAVQAVRGERPTV